MIIYLFGDCSRDVTYYTAGILLPIVDANDFLPQNMDEVRADLQEKFRLSAADAALACLWQNDGDIVLWPFQSQIDKYLTALVGCRNVGNTIVIIVVEPLGKWSAHLHKLQRITSNILTYKGQPICLDATPVATASGWGYSRTTGRKV